MFRKKVSGEAKIISDEGIVGSFSETDFHGHKWVHQGYIVEVQPEGGSPFRAEVKAKVALFCPPRVGDTVRVHYDDRDHKAELDLDGDDRYNPRVVSAKRKTEDEAQREAVLNGATPSAGVNFDDESDDEDDEWEAPVKCPECGARVDPLDETVAEAHRCSFCHSPLPAATR